jgi:hypothetical protein
MVNTGNYRVTMERRTGHGDPVITPLVVTKNQYNRILKIIYERTTERHGTGKNYNTGEME